jgi:hypothetical protein
MADPGMGGPVVCQFCQVRFDHIAALEQDVPCKQWNGKIAGHTRMNGQWCPRRKFKIPGQHIVSQRPLIQELPDGAVSSPRARQADAAAEPSEDSNAATQPPELDKPQLTSVQQLPEVLAPELGTQRAGQTARIDSETDGATGRRADEGSPQRCSSVAARRSSSDIDASETCSFKPLSTEFEIGLQMGSRAQAAVAMTVISQGSQCPHQPEASCRGASPFCERPGIERLASDTSKDRTKITRAANAIGDNHSKPLTRDLTSGSDGAAVTVGAAAVSSAPFCLLECTSIRSYTKECDRDDIRKHVTDAHLVMVKDDRKNPVEGCFNSRRVGSMASRDRMYCVSMEPSPEDFNRAKSTASIDAILGRHNHGRRPPWDKRKYFRVINTKYYEGQRQVNAFLEERLKKNPRDTPADLQDEPINPSKSPKTLRAFVNDNNLIYRAPSKEGTDPWQVEPLSLTDREHIMGFPEGWVTNSLPLDSPLNAAKMLGNSWHVPTAALMLTPAFQELKILCDSGQLGTLNNPLVVLSMFDGIGAGLCAIEKLVYQFKLQHIHLRFISVEIDHDCRSVVKKNFSHLQKRFEKLGGKWDHTDRWHDARQAKSTSEFCACKDCRKKQTKRPKVQFGSEQWIQDQIRIFKSIDLVLAGWPCVNASGHNTARSTNGRTGLSGPQTRLFYDMMEVVKRIQDISQHPGLVSCNMEELSDNSNSNGNDEQTAPERANGRASCQHNLTFGENRGGWQNLPKVWAEPSQGFVRADWDDQTNSVLNKMKQKCEAKMVDLKVMVLYQSLLKIKQKAVWHPGYIVATCSATDQFSIAFVTKSRNPKGSYEWVEYAGEHDLRNVHDFGPNSGIVEPGWPQTGLPVDSQLDYADDTDGESSNDDELFTAVRRQMRPGAGVAAYGHVTEEVAVLGEDRNNDDDGFAPRLGNADEIGENESINKTNQAAAAAAAAGRGSVDGGIRRKRRQNSDDSASASVDDWAASDADLADVLSHDSSDEDEGPRHKKLRLLPPEPSTRHH